MLMSLARDDVRFKSRLAAISTLIFFTASPQKRHRTILAVSEAQFRSEAGVSMVGGTKPMALPIMIILGTPRSRLATRWVSVRAQQTRPSVESANVELALYSVALQLCVCVCALPIYSANDSIGSAEQPTKTKASTTMYVSQSGMQSTTCKWQWFHG